MTSAAGVEVARLVPEIDDVITHAAPWMKATAEWSGSGADLGMIARLREESFDATVIFTVYSQSPLPSAFLTYIRN